MPRRPQRTQGRSAEQNSQLLEILNLEGENEIAVLNAKLTAAADEGKLGAKNAVSNALLEHKTRVAKLRAQISQQEKAEGEEKKAQDERSKNPPAADLPAASSFDISSGTTGYVPITSSNVIQQQPQPLRGTARPPQQQNVGSQGGLGEITNRQTRQQSFIASQKGSVRTLGRQTLESTSTSLHQPTIAIVGDAFAAIGPDAEFESKLNKFANTPKGRSQGGLMAIEQAKAARIIKHENLDRTRPGRIRAYLDSITGSPDPARVEAAIRAQERGNGSLMNDLSREFQSTQKQIDARNLKNAKAEGARLSENLAVSKAKRSAADQVKADAKEKFGDNSIQCKIAGATACAQAHAEFLAAGGIGVLGAPTTSGQAKSIGDRRAELGQLTGSARVSVNADGISTVTSVNQQAERQLDDSYWMHDLTIRVVRNPAQADGGFLADGRIIDREEFFFNAAEILEISRYLGDDKTMTIKEQETLENKMQRSGAFIPGTVTGADGKKRDVLVPNEEGPSAYNVHRMISYAQHLAIASENPEDEHIIQSYREDLIRDQLVRVEGPDFGDVLGGMVGRAIVRAKRRLGTTTSEVIDHVMNQARRLTEVDRAFIRGVIDAIELGEEEPEKDKPETPASLIQQSKQNNDRVRAKASAALGR